MKKNLVWLALAALLVVLLVAAGSLYNTLKDEVDVNNLAAQATAPPQQTEAPKPAAPDFTVVDENGTEVRLSSFVGKPVVVNFWASWCGPCKSEMPDFQKAWELYGDQVEFMIVNMTDGSQETVESARAYVTKQGYTFPVYYDTLLSAATAYSVRSIPATYFISADGSVKARANGALSYATLERGLKMIMGDSDE